MVQELSPDPPQSGRQIVVILWSSLWRTVYGVKNMMWTSSKVGLLRRMIANVGIEDIDLVVIVEGVMHINC